MKERFDNIFAIDVKLKEGDQDRLRAIITRYAKEDAPVDELAELFAVAGEITEKLIKRHEFTTHGHWRKLIGLVNQDIEGFVENMIMYVDGFRERFPGAMNFLDHGDIQMAADLAEEIFRREALYAAEIDIGKVLGEYTQPALAEIVSARKKAKRYKMRYLDAAAAKEKQDDENDAVAAEEKQYNNGEAVIVGLPHSEPEAANCLKDFVKNESPEGISNKVKDYVVGQNEAVKRCSRVLYEHVYETAFPEYEFEKNNYLIIGPTGCGKTEIWRQLKKISPLPIEIIDSTSITSQGFKGLDKEDVMLALRDANPNIESGIIIFDEFDKLCSPVFSGSGENINKTIQKQLLKLVEGTTLIGKRGEEFNTEGITFGFAGAFEGLREILEEEKPGGGIGFVSAESSGDGEKELMEALIAYGMIPEMAGRIGNTICLRPLYEDDYYEILTRSKASSLGSIVKKYKLFYNVSFEFTEECLRAVAKIAHQKKLGARSMNNILEYALNEKLPGRRLKRLKKIMIDAGDIKAESRNIFFVREGDAV